MNEKDYLKVGVSLGGDGGIGLGEEIVIMGVKIGVHWKGPHFAGYSNTYVEKDCGKSANVVPPPTRDR